MGAEHAQEPEADRMEALHAVLESGSVVMARRMLNALHPAEIAHQR